jgi:hypothetical protein
MNKTLRCAALIAASVLLGAPATARASTLTYDVTFAGGPVSGSGSFTISAPPVGSGGTVSPSALSFTFSDPGSPSFTPVTFTSQDTSASVTYFYQGTSLVLASLALFGNAGPDSLFSFTLGSSGFYVFADNAPGGAIYDTIGSLSVSQTPLPNSLPLLATGLGIIAMIGWYRKRKAGTLLAA